MDQDKLNHPESFPCTDLQKAYLFGRQKSAELFTGSHGYCEFDIQDLDESKIERIQHQLYNRHPMLRVEVVDGLSQRILDKVIPPQIKITDLRNLPQEEIDRRLLELRHSYSHYWNEKPGFPVVRFMISRLPGNLSRLHCHYDIFSADGVSVLILLSEIEAMYTGREDLLGVPSFRFHEYAGKMAAGKKSGAYQEAREYWLKRLPEMAGGPEFPLMNSGPFIRESFLKRRVLELDSKTAESLMMLARKMEVSIGAVYLYCYMRTIAFWAKKPKFSVCMMISERLRRGRDIDQTVGNFSNIILVEMDFSRVVPLDEDLDNLNRQITQSLLHLDYNGIDIIQEMNRQRTMAGKTPVPVAFVSNIGWAKALPENACLNLFSLENAVYTSLATPHMYLDHQVNESRDGSLKLIWDSADDLFFPGVPESMFSVYREMLLRLAENHELAGSPLSIPLPLPQQQILDAVHRTDGYFPDITLHGLFRKSVSEFPENVALVCGDRRITYKELDELSSGIAAAVGQIGHGDLPVAVITDKHEWQIAAILGILKAGSAYLPVNPRFPEERIKQLIRLGKCRVVVTEQKYCHLFDENSGVIVADKELPSSGSDAVFPEKSAHSTAYIIFTSGSTGEPKGVVISHRAAVNTIWDINRRFGVGPEDRAFAISAITFDLSVYDIFGMLAAGGTIIMPDSDRIREPAYWQSVILNEKATVWNSAPPVLQMLENHLEGISFDQLFSFRLIMLSGDWIPLNLPEAFRKRCPDCTFVSLGGATEAGIWSNFHIIDRIDPAWKSIPYGMPLTNQNLYILDEQLHQRPLFAVGQIHIGGESLADGYWEDDVKTRNAFIRDFKTGKKLYKTGDLGRYLADGSIEILGREDSQVKIRGYRIELGEIESAMEKHPGIRRGLVKVYDRSGEKQLAAYISLQPSFQWDSGDAVKCLRDYLARLLPEYMIPGFFLVLDEFPLSPNGKIDRKALPDPSEGNPSVLDEPDLPADEIEGQLQSLWENLIGKPAIGVKQNFFEIGGDSFLAVRMTAEIKRLLGYTVPVSHLFEGGTIRSQADFIRKGALRTSWSPLVTIRREGNGKPVYFVHPSGGNVLCYRHLSSTLGIDSPFYGLKAMGLEKEEMLHDSVQDMAEAYIGTIEKMNHQDDFILIGWSSGGVIAYEMARTIQSRYGRAPELVIIDFPAPLGYSITDESTVLKLFIRDITGGKGVFGSEFLEELEERIAMGSGMISDDLLEFIRPTVAGDMAPDQFSAIYRVFSRIISVISLYEPSHLKGDMLLIRAENNVLQEYQALESKEDPSCGWRNCIDGGLRVEFCPGDHYSMMDKENVPLVADLIRSHCK